MALSGAGVGLFSALSGLGALGTLRILASTRFGAAVEVSLLEVLMRSKTCLCVRYVLSMY